VSDGLDLSKMLDVLRKVQGEISRVDQELVRITVEGSAGGGMVVARANAKHQLLSIHIEPQLIAETEVQMLQDLVVAAVNQAMARAGERAQQELAKISGGLGFALPGLFGR
jgi:hypothetical protein